MRRLIFGNYDVGALRSTCIRFVGTDYVDEMKCKAQFINLFLNLKSKTCVFHKEITGNIFKYIKKFGTLFHLIHELVNELSKFCSVILI